MPEIINSSPSPRPSPLRGEGVFGGVFFAFYDSIKFLENILDYAADKFLRAHPGTPDLCIPQSEFRNRMSHCLEREFMLNFRLERKRI